MSFKELFELAERLDTQARRIESVEIITPLTELESAARTIGNASSGSWLGYHSRVYYAKFAAPPPGAHFSQEWGLKDMQFSSLGSQGQWQEYRADEVEAGILGLTKGVDLNAARAAAVEASREFKVCKSDIASIIQGELDEASDSFLKKLLDELEVLHGLSTIEVAEYLSPKGQLLTRDSIAAGQGTQIPPHILFIAEVQALQSDFAVCATARDLARRAASHLERKSKRKKATDRIGTNVFIGHGRSHVWRDLKDFLVDRAKLPFDEFNRIPVAGVTNVARLNEMLDAAAVAFLIMTAEDETIDGKLHARLNVIHEVGLFQGRLGFTRAIVLVEEGCEQFSNIEGLGQIRFPRGNIAAVFEEIRRVLEREGLL